MITPVRIRIGARTVDVLLDGELGPEAIVALQDAERVQHGLGTVCYVSARPGVWAEIVHRLDLLTARMPLTPSDGFEPPESGRIRRLRNAQLAIEKQLNRLANHPAYLGKHILGVATQHLEAHRRVDPTGLGQPTRWWPTAYQAAMDAPTFSINETTVLIPQERLYRKRRLTHWVPDPTANDPLRLGPSPGRESSPTS